MAAGMTQVRTIRVQQRFHPRSTPPPLACSADTLYGLLSAHGSGQPPPPQCSQETLYALLSGDGRSRVDVNRQFMFEAEIRDKWIRALRSGHYSQACGYWHIRDQVCAVEVILHELGYEDSGPRQPLIPLIGVALCKEVIGLNDQLQWSFEEIANWLETHTKPVSRAAARDE